MSTCQRCPCCGQWMPHTDFQLYPKSGAAMREGYVLIFGPVQYRIIECLYKCWPDYVPTERIRDYVYAGTKRYEMATKTLHAHLRCVRRKLKTLKCSLISHKCYGYRLVIDPAPRPYKSGRKPKTLIDTVIQ